MRIRADDLLVQRGLVQSRSQAASLIKLGKVWIAARRVTKPGQQVYDFNAAKIVDQEKYVSRAGFKLASAAKNFNLYFKDKVVLDVGSSTGGFTDFALQHGAQKVIAVDVGTDQLHPSLHKDPKIELHEKTDIRDLKSLVQKPDLVVIDVSFISLRQILPHIVKLAGKEAAIVALLKPQFEAGDQTKHKGVIKNDKLRRDIIKNFELWARELFVIQAKADSEVSGSKGNRERFYLLRSIKYNKLTISKLFVIILILF